MKNKILILTLCFTSLFGYAQSEKDIINITKDYDVALIKSKAKEFKILEEKEKARAYDFSLKNNIPMSYTDSKGNFHELVRITSDGFPIYRSTENQAAAKSTRAVQLNTGGSLGLTLNGQGMVARVWDGGTVRAEHNHFGGRVVSIDDGGGTTYIQHATHVTGTILANSTNLAHRGMAYEATGRTFNWTSDQTEVLDEVLGGMLISNHSYGVPVTNNNVTLPAWYIGTYDQDAKNWDEIAYLAPYYLMVASAGNSGEDENNTNPISFGTDKLTGNKTAKNNLVIANCLDVSVNSVGDILATPGINTSSSQGPTDDRRIKPDITGNGTGLTSTSHTSNTSTATLTGTSMASPNVAGTLLLLQQHHNNLTTKFMKAATLKGLACHTANDSGSIGPDINFGWGLLNAKAAAQAITSNGLNAWISEEKLNQGQTYTITVKSLGTSPLMASACWTDVPGDPNNGQRGANDLTRALVNDLDVRITRNGTTYFPWKLDSDPTLDATRFGDNNIDNVEQVKIDAPPAGDYVITVTHKGTLVTNKQDFSLIITGVTSGFAIIPTSNDLEVCANQDATYTFNYSQTGTTTTNFSTIGLPSGATAVFTPSSRNSNGPVSLTVSNLSAVNPGNYNMGIVGNNGLETETRYKNLKIFSSTFTPVVISSPINNQVGVATTVNLKWNVQANAESYQLQVSSSPSFATTILNVSNIIGNSYIVSNLTQQTTYYWRVSPSNRCGAAIVSNATVNNFQTGVLSCGNEFSATNFSNATIASTANAIASVPIVVTGGFTIGDLNVALNISHTYIQDFKVKLTGPASIGSPVIILLDQPCGDNDNVNCTMDDSGIAVACSTAVPALTGSVIPSETLTALNGLIADGTWTLTVDDPYNGDGGTINSVKLIICSIQLPLSVADTTFSNLKIYPNPTTGFVNIDLGNQNLESNSIVKLFDIQGRIISTKEMKTAVDNVNISNLSDGVYIITIENGSSKTTKKIVLAK
ncbi:S8 family serine peptidase [Flavobacterium sp.]|uniref:S8 family serine peptidase n=1 Tax=Flavobacterium sp. TaxID=239 RepID=UPI00334185BA